MISFWIGAALLVALALAFLLWPLLRKAGAAGASDGAIVSLYREQLRELSAELQAGTISAEQHENQRREVERRLLEDVSRTAAGAVAAPSRRPVGTILFVTALVIVLPAGLYLQLGTPAALTGVAPAGPTESAGQPEAGAKEAPHQVTPEQVQAMVDQLVKRLEQNPKDADGWGMLGRTRAYQHQFPEAVKAFAKAAELAPNDARLLADYADALAMTQGRKLAGEPMKLIARALAISPTDLKALALAGSDAFERHDYDSAIKLWEKAISSNPGNAQFTNELRSGIQEARQLSGKAPEAPMAQATGPSMATPSAATAPAPSSDGGSGAAAHAVVKGQVRLAAALAAKAAPTDTLFIFARATDGPRIPLALLKRQVKDLPVDFALDETMSMVPNINLSKYNTVIIGARISHGGDAIASSGDLQGFSAPVKVGSSGVQVQIDQVVP